MKKKNTQKLGQGNIARAFGKILKLSSGPDNYSSSIPIPSCFEKCPRYMKMFSAHRIPHITIDAGII